MRSFIAEVRHNLPLIRSEKDIFLADTIPLLIDSIDAWMDYPNNLATIQNIDQGSIQHAKNQASVSGISLTDVLSEYHILRRIIVDFLASSEERELINNSIDFEIERTAQVFFHIWTRQTQKLLDRQLLEKLGREQFIHTLSL